MLYVNYHLAFLQSSSVSLKTKSTHKNRMYFCISATDKQTILRNKLNKNIHKVYSENYKNIVGTI